ncbi:hypothetical protein SteCoe_23160 [Stentor coeruleus]|uniref:Uncharacterized protein n=1 Tax=Stentor coeruleus TaxID=5963 RepID=A0A1R2BKN9_9CILI|nr:hypothetical protein SteCoe_23160 [Stentor coeruleus]
MEFSETLELKRIAKYRNNQGECSPFTKLVKSWTKQNSSEKSQVTPFIFKPLIHSPSFSECSNALSPAGLEKFEKDFEIVQDNSYLDELKKKKNSILTLSLKNSEETVNNSPIKQLTLKIYFFRSLNKINLSVPKEIMVNDMITRALQAYSKTKYPSLPYGINSEAYEVWLPDEDGIFPDTDYTIDKSSFVSHLNATTLCILEKANFQSSLYTSKRDSSVLRIRTKTGLIHLKFLYKSNWAVIALNPESHLYDVLGQLWKKFFILGELSAKMFEFRVFIEEGGYECALDMSLKIKEIPKQDIRLYRKVLADTPKKFIRRNHKSQQIFFNSKYF